MISEKSIFKDTFSPPINPILHTLAELLRDELVIDKNVFTTAPKELALSIANKLHERTHKYVYVRGIHSKTIYALFDQGELIATFWRVLFHISADHSNSSNTSNGGAHHLSDLEKIFRLQQDYSLAAEIEPFSGETQLPFTPITSGKFRAKNYWPELVYVTPTIAITNNLRNFSKKLRAPIELCPVLNDLRLRRISTPEITIYNAAEYSVIPFFRAGKYAVASALPNYRFQLIHAILNKLPQTPEPTIFDPYSLPPEYLYGTDLFGQISDPRADYEPDSDYRPRKEKLIYSFFK